MAQENFGIEIDFLAVGDGSRSADAIAIRYGNLHSGDLSQQWVVVIDGGTNESGKALVEHVKRYYGTDYVDLVVMTHPDRDHASGLTHVLEGLRVEKLWMHQPWSHSPDILRHFLDGRITNSSLERRLRVSMDAAHEVEEIALKKKIPIIEPFAGLRSPDGVITVLGPSLPYYQQLLPAFSKTPESTSSPAKSYGSGNNEVQRVMESLDTERLPGDITSAENNSSAVLLFQIPGRRVLITGDAGVPALEEVIRYAASSSINLANLDFMQVPHHGSKKNVNSHVLNAIKADVAFISAAKEGAPKHPSQRVINALRRRGTYVLATRGMGIVHAYNAPPRQGWGAVETLPFTTFYSE